MSIDLMGARLDMVMRTTMGDKEEGLGAWIIAVASSSLNCFLPCPPQSVLLRAARRILLNPTSVRIPPLHRTLQVLPLTQSKNQSPHHDPEHPSPHAPAHHSSDLASYPSLCFSVVMWPLMAHPVSSLPRSVRAFCHLSSALSPSTPRSPHLMYYNTSLSEPLI